MTTRRELLIAPAAAVLTASLSCFAQQQSKVWRVGVLSQQSRPAPGDPGNFGTLSNFGAFLQGMRDLGYVEGRNLAVEWRSAEGNNERLAGLAAELVNLKVDVILSGNTPGHRAAQRSTAAIPIVMVGGTDPVAQGLAKSLAHPGGNITGVTNVSSELAVKHLDMLLRMVPKLARVAVLLNPSNPGNLVTLKSVRAAAGSTSASIVPAEAQNASALEEVFSAMVRGKTEAFIVANDSFLILHLRQIADLAAKSRLPSISAQEEFVKVGGLMSFGPNGAEQSRRAATYVDKIFKGAKPGDLPIEQPSKFELGINSKTAKALGLVIPQALAVSADRVIQ